MGSIGVFLAILRLANVAVFSQRYWFYLQLLVELGLAIYLVYYIRMVYPRLLERSQASRPRGAVRRETARSLAGNAVKNGSSEPVESRPVATAGTGRRGARRERKRKNR
jgi:membrane protein implicated in regulation of membrane protease activity